MSRDVAAKSASGVGRPRKQPPQDAALKIQQLAAGGCNVKDLAAALGTTREVLSRWMTEDESLALAFAVGRERERQELHDLVMRDARDGEKANVNAMFLLKARHGYREGDPVDSGTPRLQITFNLPGAMSREDFLKTVVNDERDI